jgi:tetratricopeptide (TPR) repeat protein
MPSLPLPVEPSPIANQVIGFVGKLTGMNRRELKQVVEELGGTIADSIHAEVDLIVLGDDVQIEEAIKDAEVSQAVQSGRLPIINESEFWQSLGFLDDQRQLCQSYTPAMLAELLHVSVTSVRRWHRRGLIRAVRQVNRLPYFDFAQIAAARKIAELVSGGASPAAIESQLARFVQQSPGLECVLSQWNVTVEGKSILLRSERGLIETDGQRRFDFFEHDSTAAEMPEPRLIAIPNEALSVEPSRFATPDEFLRLAVELEDAGDIESACEVYRSLLIAHGPSADVCFRLAENLFQLGDLTAARERYYAAIELDEEFVEARASLGCLLVELGKRELAVSAFEGALQFHPDYPDVLYQLARLLDDMGRGEQADNHWRSFLVVCPSSPWSDEARVRLGILE